MPYISASTCLYNFWGNKSELETVRASVTWIGWMNTQSSTQNIVCYKHEKYQREMTTKLQVTILQKTLIMNNKTYVYIKCIHQLFSKNQWRHPFRTMVGTVANRESSIKCKERRTLQIRTWNWTSQYWPDIDPFEWQTSRQLRMYMIEMALPNPKLFFLIIYKLASSPNLIKRKRVWRTL